jgi:riboflavin synthase
MFTGIVEERGRVRSITPNEGGARLVVDARTVIEDAGLGDSIAVNGCCLTVVELGEGWFAADAVTETLTRTAIGELVEGDPVNLERPLRLADRLGGHLVQGHVDGVGTVTGREPLPDGSTLVEVAAPPSVLRYIVEKGSITVDGISLTVTHVDGGSFAFAAIPHTLAVTTLGDRGVGAAVNLEVDMVAKYVERFVTVSRET